MRHGRFTRYCFDSRCLLLVGGVALACLSLTGAGLSFATSTAQAQSVIDRLRDTGRAVQDGAQRQRDNARNQLEQQRERAAERSRDTGRAVQDRIQRERENAQRQRDNAQRQLEQQRERAAERSRDTGRAVQDRIQRQRENAQRQLEQQRERAGQGGRDLFGRLDSLVRDTVPVNRGQVRTGTQARSDAWLRDLQGNLHQRARDATQRYDATSAARIGEAYGRATAAVLGDLGRVRRLGGEAGLVAVERTIAVHGAAAGIGVARALASGQLPVNERMAADLMQRARPVMDRVAATLKDPAVRDRAIEAAVVAAAVGYYGVRLKQDVGYIATRAVLQNTVIMVDGEPRTAESLITAAVLEQFPMLEGTRLAEDPAAVMAYGVVAVGRDDLMRHARVVPDGRGGTVTVAQALSATDLPFGQTADTLLLGASMEGAMLSAAEHGHMGRHAVTFAATQHELDRRLGR